MNFYLLAVIFSNRSEREAAASVIPVANKGELLAPGA